MSITMQRILHWSAICTGFGLRFSTNAFLYTYLVNYCRPLLYYWTIYNASATSVNLICSSILPHTDLMPVSFFEKSLYYGQFLAYVGFNLCDSRRWFDPMGMLGLDLKGQWGGSRYWIGRIFVMFVVDRLVAPFVPFLGAAIMRVDERVDVLE